jgi:hypothetical protein
MSKTHINIILNKTSNDLEKQRLDILHMYTISYYLKVIETLYLAKLKLTEHELMT